MSVLKYRDIYSTEFLKKFDSNSDQIGSLEIDLNIDPSIDVREIADILNIKIEELIMTDSGRYDANKKTIFVNSIEPEYRQRFTIAHEMGHAVLGHEGVSYRSDILDKYEDTIKKSREVRANKFAAELLMPKDLVFKLVMKLIEEENLDSTSLEYSQVEEIIKNCAKKLNVSEISMKYAIQNNRIFVTKG
ncbi:TPA: ImmA/IrrE family metallo-endopeptidase [Enterococcus faecalis]|uniref:ImmA/IrrE family metallo-endopeptidase n=1 Tax=Enterococcus TaxID=1350 RepID=UPI000DEBC402|nr:ImmA/IrrE family metallo-endopeptidase [Enterococcus faecalis]DAW19484.1 MAG TPA: IrrE protein [Caudoviricetes sp.]EGO2664875.1 ImmA/IrrE family metallo-endopeptidase [Enterococcus faecalis]EGO5029864.1 ImmA/IrrE family metallo-endopeptidase [Enterococcus faecalis]EGO7769168.1 ImmA/IrrE family metallo-endopeptidase [Enterococcus faecalis]MCD5180591.1 ImmA/IrrE family metallo-endopeptidase [Enterococcus faecalis]